MPASRVGAGYLDVLTIGREDTWSTAKTPSKNVPFFSFNGRADEPRIRPKFLNGGVIMARPKVVVGGKRALIDMSIPILDSGPMMIFDAILGTAAFDTDGCGAPVGSGPYVRTWSDIKKILNSYTIHHGTGDIPTTRCERFTGMKVSKATFKCSAADDESAILTCDLNWVGRRLEADVAFSSLGAPDVDDSSYFMFQHLTTLSHHSGTTAERTLDWQLEIENPILDKRLLMEGSGYVSEPIRNGRPIIRLTLTEEFQTKAALDAYIANTKGPIQTTFTNGINILTFTLDAALVEFPDHETNDEGMLEQKLVYEGEYDAGTGGTALGVIFTNSEALVE